MTMHLDMYDKEGHSTDRESEAVSKTTSDDMNPRIYREEVRCFKCGGWFDDEQIVWATMDGTLSTLTGDPYCEACCPEEPE